jgi:hypothetical protein
LIQLFDGVNQRVFRCLPRCLFSRLVSAYSGCSDGAGNGALHSRPDYSTIDCTDDAENIAPR